MNERYILFAGDNYHPDGGWGDFVGKGTEGEMKARFSLGWQSTGTSFDWGHLVNSETLEIEFIWDYRSKIWR